MPELTYLTAYVGSIHARYQAALAAAEAEGRPRDAGDIVQYVVITAALAIAAVAIVAIIVTKITAKANGLQTQ